MDLALQAERRPESAAVDAWTRARRVRLALSRGSGAHEERLASPGAASPSQAAHTPNSQAHPRPHRSALHQPPGPRLDAGPSAVTDECDQFVIGGTECSSWVAAGSDV